MLRRWLALFAVVVLIVFAALNAAGVFSEHGRQAVEADGIYAADGAETAFDVTPGTFSGSYTPKGACGVNGISIPAGTGTIDVSVTATLPTNDIAIALVDPSGHVVATSDVATSPEVIHYSSSSIAAGSWNVQVCESSAPAVTSIPPTTYTGVYTATPLGTPTVPGLPGSGGGGTSTGTAGTPTPTRTAGDLRFSPETIVDPQRTEGEPVNFFAPDGSYWESGPFGTSSQQSWIHRSTDNGLEFHETSPVGIRPDAPPGGGDTDVVVDDQGYAYFSDLEGLANVGTSVSNDGGNSWRKNTVAAQEAGVDRQWFAMDNGPTSAASDNTVFFTYRQVPLGPQILSSPGSTGPNDQVGGLQWTNAASANGQINVSSGAPCGKMIFDPVKRNLYLPCGQTGSGGVGHIELVVGHVAPSQRTGIDFVQYELPPSPGGGGVGTVFPWVGVDKGGNLMAVWVDRNDRQVYETVSTDAGKTWTTPIRVDNPAPVSTNAFPEVTGADAGTFVVTWYGNDSATSSDNQPANTDPTSANFPWYGRVAVIKNATTLTPSIAQQNFTEHPMHYGQVCNSGTTCTSGRTMADYFDVGIDQHGAIRIVFDDESSQYRQAHLMEVRQLTSGPAPSSPMEDPTNDAQIPHYSPTGPGPNLPQADFTRLALSQPSAGVLRVQMSLASLANLAPPAGKSTLVWLTRFQAKSTSSAGEAYRIFYVGAKSTAGGTPTFFAGSGDGATGCISTSSSGCKIVIYPAEQTLTSGTVSGNTITVDVSLQNGFGSGRPIDGSTLYSVTALSYGENSDADIYAEGDATHSFDYKLGGSGAPPAVPQPTAKPSGQPIDKGVKGSSGESAVVSAKHSAIGKGRTRHAAFRVSVTSLHAVLTWTQKGVRLHAIRLTSARFGKHAATFRGLAKLNGRRVRFAAVVVDHGKKGDVFKVDWNGGPSRGGVLRAGGITVK